MRVPLGRTLCAVAVLLASLVVVQAAAADTYCVGSGSGCTDLQTALDSAAANPGPDDITVDAGTFNASGGFTYPISTDQVTITGAGTSTKLTAGTASTFAATGGPVALNDLEVDATAGQTAVELDKGGSLDNVTISGTTGTGLAITSSNVDVSNSTIAMDPSVTSEGLHVVGPGGTTSLTDTTVTAQTGLSASAGPTVHTTRTAFSGANGVNASDSDVSLTNTLIEKLTSGGVPVTFHDDALGSTLTATNLSAVDKSDETGDFAIDASATGGGPVTLNVAASLFAGFDNYRNAGTGVAQQLDTDELSATLAGAKVTAGYVPQADSALIDRAPDAGAGSTDLAGHPRAVHVLGADSGRNRDIGALEFQPHAPVINSLTPSNATPAIGDPVTFTADAQDPDAGDQLTYHWSFDGVPTTDSSSAPSHSFAHPGQHTATVVVTDLAGNSASASTSVTVPNHPPTVAIGASDLTPDAGQDVAFNANANDADGDPLHYLWSFDGSTPTSGTAFKHHTFQTPGQHTAAVTVVDSSGASDSAGLTLTVPSPPQQQPAQQQQAQQQQVATPPPVAQLRAGVCINAFNGTPGVDRLTGSNFGDAIVGGGGNDVLSGLGGDDCLIGDEGNDRLSGGDGDDDLRGLAGNDTIRGGAGNDNLLGGSGNDLLDGGAGNDALNGGSGVDRFKGGAGNDTINSADGKAETVDCGSGRDSVKADRTDKLISCEKRKLVGKKPKH